MTWGESIRNEVSEGILIQSKIGPGDLAMAWIGIKVLYNGFRIQYFDLTHNAQVLMNHFLDRSSMELEVTWGIYRKTLHFPLLLVEPQPFHHFGHPATSYPH